MTNMIDQLEQAKQLYKQVDQLLDKASDLMKPFSNYVLSQIKDNPQMNINELNNLLFKMPSSFERSELRAYYNQQHNIKIL